MPKSDAVDLNVDPLGLGKVIKRLGLNVFENVVKAGGRAADDIVGQGRLRAPIKDGDLRRSIHREGDYSITEATGKSIDFTIRADALYAAIQHENSDFVHPKGGEDHFLTKPAKERKSVHLAMIQDAVIRGMKDTSAGK